MARTWTSRDSANGTRSVDTSYCYSPYVAGQPCPTSSASTDSALIRWSVDHTTGDRSIYTYDSGNRLTKATNYQGHTYDYTYDKAGNRTTTKVDGALTQSLSFNAVNQISTTGYTFDGAGNRTRDGSTGKNLAYDAANRMTSATGGGNTVTYSYAGRDQRELIGKTTGFGTDFAYTYGREDRNGNPLLETFTRDGKLYSIDYDPDGTPIALNIPGGNQHFYALDGQGTVQSLVNDNGVESGTYTYTPYGDILGATGPGDAVGQNVYRHTLGFIDSGTGGTNWTKHGIRWNDNTTGTWTTQDPLSFVLDPRNGNRYAFAGSDPVNNVDPTGFSCATAISGGVLGAISTGFGAVGLFTAPLTTVPTGGGSLAVSVISFEAGVAGLALSADAISEEC